MMRRFLLFLFILSSTLTFAQWNQLAGPAGAGTIQDLEYVSSGNRVYAVADNRLYTTTNDGTSWTKVTPTNGNDINLSDLLVDGTTLYALDYSSFYKSEDNGATWVRTNVGAAGQFYGTQKITKLGAGTFAVYGWNGVYVSTDSGVSWTQITSNKDTRGVVVNGAGDMIVSDPDGIKKHVKPAAGQPWTSASLLVIRANTPTLGHNQIAIDASSNIYAISLNPSTYQGFDIVRSTNGGSTWASIKGTAGTALAIATTDYVYPWDNNHILKVSPDGKLYLASGSGGNRIHVASNPSVSTATSVTWTVATAGPVSTRSDPSVSAMSIVSATKAFIGTFGDGIMLTTNLGTSGTTWSYRTDGIFSIYGKEIEVAGTRILLIANYSSKGFYQSTNGGTSWSFVTLSDYIQSLLKMPNGTLIAYGGSGLFRSTDNGATWSAKVTQGFNDIEATPANVLYGSTGSQIKVSSDNGATWPTILTITGLPASYYFEMFTLDASSGVDLFVYLYNYTLSKRELYKITVTGANGTASLIQTPPSFNSDYGVNSMFVNDNKFYLAQYDNIYYSSDKGISWNSVSYSNHKVIPIAGGICVSNYGSLYVTQDDGLSWNNTSLPGSNILIQDIAVDASGDFYAAAVSAGTLKNTNDLVVPPASLPPYINFNWQATNGPFGGEVYNLMKDNSNVVYANQYNNYFKANPAVTTWQRVTTPNNLYISFIDVKKTTGELFGLTYDRIYKSLDGGSTWTSFNAESIFNRQRTVICPNGNMAMFADNKIYVSTNGGTTFGTAKLTLNPTESYYQFDNAFVSTSSNVILIELYDNATFKEKLKRSSDNGTTWVDVVVPQDYINRLTVDNAGNIYLVNNQGMYRSSDNGTTWTSIKGNLTDGYGYQARISVSPTNELYFPTFGGSGGNNTKLMKSVNGGTTWTTVGDTPLEIFDLTWVGTKMVAATPDGVITSTDNGVTWVTASSGITLVNTTDLLLASQNRMLVGSTSSSYTSVDNGAVWSKDLYNFRQYFSMPDGSIVGLSRNGDKGYRSIDQGATWLLHFTFPQSGQQYFTPNGTDHYMRTYQDIYYSGNLTTWTKLTISGFPQSNDRFITDIAADNNGILYAIIYNYQTTKQEAYQVLFGSGSVLNVTTNARSLGFYQGKIFVFGSEGSLSSTEDGGTWQKRSVPGGNKFIIAARDYYFIPSGNNTLWLSRDLGQTWQSVGLTGISGNFNFKDVVLNEFDGYAYAILENSVVRKSANIVIPDDGTAPIVSTLLPGNNATAVSTKPSLTITFDEGVVPQSGKTLRILDVANPITPIETISITAGVQAGKSFTFTLTNFLEFNKQYFVVIDAGAYKDLFGNNFSGILNNTTWRFTTKIAPTLNTLSPVKNATGVALTPSLAMTFSEKVGVGSAKQMKIYESTNLTTPVESIDLKLPATNTFVQMFPADNSVDQLIKVIFNASIGGGELKGASKVYMHAGVVLSDAAGLGWSNVVGNWGLDNGIGQMTKVAGETDLWEISLSPTVRQYFNVPAGTPIYRLAVVFRSADGILKASPPSTIPGGSIAVNGDVYLNFGAGSTSCKPLIEQANTTVTITPCTTLKYATEYIVKLDNGAFTSSEGFPMNFLTTNTDWTFTTKAAPTVITTTPAHNSTGIALATTLAITVSEPISAVTGKNIGIYKVNQPSTPVATQDVSTGLISGNTITLTLANPLEATTTYFVKLDEGALKSSEGVSLNLITTNTAWVFSTVDGQKPTISFTTSVLEKGVTKTFSVTVNDNESVPTDKTNIFYRGITTAATATFTSAPLTAGTGGGTAPNFTNTFSITAAESWYDAMGLEFYFETEDAAGNKERSPSTAGAYHYSYISFTNDNTYPVMNPVLSFGGAESNYRIISIPYKLTNPSIATIFDEVNGGAVDKTQWRVFTLGTGTTYVEPTTFNYGKGYWVNIRNNPGNITIEGSQTPEFNRTKFVDLILTSGWNMIGNPYPVPISWNQAKSGNTSVGSVQTFSGTGYATGDILQPLQGGFVFVQGTGTQTVKIRFQGITTGGRQDEEFSSDLSKPNWMVPIKTESNGLENAIGGIGMHEQAKLGLDQYDDFNPPRFLTMAELAFPKNAETINSFAKDVVPFNDEHIWNFKVEGGEELTTLTWNNHDITGGGSDLILFDKSRQKIIDMMMQGSYQFNPAQGRDFEIHFGKGIRDKIFPSIIYLSSPYPNPVQSETRINFGLPEGNQGYQVNLEVFNVNGQRVADLAKGAYAPGFYQVQWAPEDNSNGLYFVRLQVMTGGTPVVLTEKIIINK